ncbi:MAG TPA: Gfo/Idh/MocA family oxidoreductase [Phycisphaerae bacterium]|nr:Gfo/Idh/MocA family oxidoreductase [Phycisphaerae bacterium]
MPVTRRSFLKGSVAGAAAVAAGRTALTAAEAAGVKGANGRVNVAMVGCGGRGRYVIRGLMEQGARLTYLCDLHPERLAQCWGFLKDVQKDPPKLVQELREVYDSKDVDAVVVATPDHWHAPASILACQAGKDVYVEKPHSHNIWESGKMLEAARKHQRVLQVGTQNRSGPYNLKALEYVKSGKLGKICLVKVYNMKSGGPYKMGEPGTCPKGFDWDRWVGKAPARPYHRGIFHGGWHQFWDFSGGDMADDGIHQLDLALMLMGDPGFPKSVQAIGRRLCHKGDDSQRPDVQLVSWEFDDFLMTMDLTGYPRYMLKTEGTIRRNDVLPYWTHNATRVELYGSELMMTIGRHGGGWIVQTSGGKEVEKVYGRPCDEPHYANFLECVRSRKLPNADIAVAHKSVTTLHMGNIAHRVGDVALSYDAQAGTFDNAAANALVKPPYRKGFEIPEQV